MSTFQSLVEPNPAALNSAGITTGNTDITAAEKLTVGAAKIVGTHNATSKPAPQATGILNSLDQLLSVPGGLNLLNPTQDLGTFIARSAITLVGMGAMVFGGMMLFESIENTQVGKQATSVVKDTAKAAVIA